MATMHLPESVQKRENEEKLREVSCSGDLDAVKKMVEMGVDVNSQNIINHWTALHWACKRGHEKIVDYLLKHEADDSLETINHERCWQITPHPNFSVPFTGKPEENHRLFNSSTNSEISSNGESTPLVPNYLSNPSFPYINNTEPFPQPINPQYISEEFSSRESTVTNGSKNEMVLKVKLENKKDFIELDILDKENLTYDQLIEMITKELKLELRSKVKVRKLPNTLVRNDRDVRRLVHMQEMEVFSEENTF